MLFENTNDLQAAAKAALQANSGEALVVTLDVECRDLTAGRDCLSWAILVGVGQVDGGTVHVFGAMRLGAREFKSSVKGVDFFDENILPYMEGMPHVESAHECREAFWEVYTTLNAIAADAGVDAEWWSDVNVPVESDFLSGCQHDNVEARRWKLPCPLLDFVGIFRAHGLRKQADMCGGTDEWKRVKVAGGTDKVLAVFETLELPEKIGQHHPLFDCVASLMAAQKISGGGFRT